MQCCLTQNLHQWSTSLLQLQTDVSELHGQPFKPLLQQQTRLCQHLQNPDQPHSKPMNPDPMYPNQPLFFTLCLCCCDYDPSRKGAP